MFEQKYNIKRVLTLLILLCIAFFTTASYVSAQINVVTSAGGNGWNNSNTAAVDTTGNYYVTFNNSYNGFRHIYVRKSVDKGLTWQIWNGTAFSTSGTETPIESGGNYIQQYPAIAIDSANNVHVVWQTYTYGAHTKYQIRYSKFNGTSWSAPQDITSAAYSGYDQANPAIAIDNTNTPHVVWEGKTSTYTTKLQVNYAKWNGSAWVFTNLTNTSSYISEFASIAIDLSNNNIYVAFDQSNISGYYNIKVVKYTTSWATSALTTGNYSNRCPYITIDSSNIPQLIWHGVFSGQAKRQIRYSKYSSGAWSAVTNITNNSTYESYYPELAAFNGNLYAVWIGYTAASPTSDQVAYSRFNGSTWDSVVQVTNNGSISGQSNLGGGANGVQGFIWGGSINSQGVPTSTDGFLYYNLPTLISSNPVGSDIANIGNGQDIQVTFNGASDETNISGYRIYVIPSSQASVFNDTYATNTASISYISEPKNGNGGAHTVTLTSGLKDVVGSAIVNGTAYKIFVLSIGQNGYGNGLSTGSVDLTLSATVPVQDITPPTILLSQSPTGVTNGNVTITATISDVGSGVEVQKWASGNQTSVYFASSGTTFTGSTFIVDSNNTYTVYAKDNAGNETVETIVVSNIDKTSPIVSGAVEGGIYNTSMTITFNEGTATLNGGAFTSGSQAVAEGEYTLIVTDTAGNITTVHFTIDKTMPVITGVLDGASYNVNKTITFNEGTATLDGSGFTTGSIVSTEGAHTIVVTDAAGNAATVHFTIDKTAPIVTGVTEGAIYNTSKTITFNEGTATLNGGAFTSGSQAVAEGEHTLIVSDAGNSTTVHFTIDKTLPTNPIISINPTTSTNGTVTVTIVFAADANVKSYNINGGESNSYTAPFIVSSNCTIYAACADDAGNWSGEVSYVISNIDVIDNTPPTVNVPIETHTSISITATANATDISTPLQYLFNIGGVDQETWQDSNSYIFTGLTASTAYVIKYKAKDSVGNISDYSTILNVTTLAPTTSQAGAVTMMELRDLTNNDNASDIRLLFRGATNEANIASYKIIVSKGTIDEATASELPAARYMAVAKKGNLRLYLTCFPIALITSSGESINAAGGEYNVYVLSVGKTGYSDKLSTPLSITITTNNAGHKVTAPTPTVVDCANDGNGTDLKVSFRKPKSEVNIEAYRIIVSTTGLTLATAQSVLASGYTEVTPTAIGISYTVSMRLEQKDNGGTAIQNGTAYKVYVLAMGKNGYVNVLSSPSKLITLSQYVPGTNAVRSLRAVKVGSGHDSSNIGVSFYEPIAVSNVQEYRVFIAPSGSTLDQTTAAGISNAVLYQVVATTGRGKSHTVTLDTGKKDYSDAALAAGNYKVYVLAVGKVGYAGKLSVASGNVTLD